MIELVQIDNIDKKTNNNNNLEKNKTKNTSKMHIINKIESY